MTRQDLFYKHCLTNVSLHFIKYTLSVKFLQIVNLYINKNELKFEFQRLIVIDVIYFLIILLSISLEK